MIYDSIIKVDSENEYPVLETSRYFMPIYFDNPKLHKDILLGTGAIDINCAEGYSNNFMNYIDFDSYGQVHKTFYYYKYKPYAVLKMFFERSAKINLSPYETMEDKDKISNI